jgi:hypothetical protein
MTRFEGDWVGDPYAPSSRFTRGATIALPVGEELDIALSRAGHDQAARRREAVRAEIGDFRSPRARGPTEEMRDTSGVCGRLVSPRRTRSPAVERFPFAPRGQLVELVLSQLS